MLTPETIASLLDGSPRDRNRLATELVAMVDREVFYTLRVARRAYGRREEYTQDVLAILFADRGQVLRKWQPERASLRGYVGMIAGRYVRRQLARRGSSWPGAELDPEERTGASVDDEDLALGYRAALEEIDDWLREDGSEKDRQRFDSLFVAQRRAPEVAKEEGTSAEAIYTWASRLKKRLKEAFPHLWELIEGSGRDSDDDPKGTP